MKVLTNLNLIKRFFFLSMPFFAPDEQGVGGDPEGDAAKKAEAEKAKQQEELNKQFAERAERGKETGKKEVLDLLGVKDPDEAKALIEAARKADDEKKSELEKAEAARQKAEADAAEAKAKADEAQKQASTKLLNAEIKLAAGNAVMDKDGKKVTRPAFRPEAIPDVIAMINREKIKEKDDTFEGVEEALAELAKAKPHWLVSENPRTTGKGNSTETKEKKPAGSADEPRPRIISGL